MRISDIRISLQNEGALRAFVSITIDGGFVVRGMKVLQKKSGLIVEMPSRRRPDGTSQAIAHPASPEDREFLESAVLAAYRGELARNRALARIELTIASDASPQVVAEIITSLDRLHRELTQDGLREPVIRIGVVSELISSYRESES